jgi:hypothetical protein
MEHTTHTKKGEMHTILIRKPEGTKQVGVIILQLILNTYEAVNWIHAQDRIQGQGIVNMIMNFFVISFNYQFLRKDFSPYNFQEIILYYSILSVRFSFT